ncbi:MAG: hypothetical protein KDC24_13680 [Saprospiraceae bacterium]|nr:hypothetical protein [Saprospiraceae bacterium]
MSHHHGMTFLHGIQAMCKHDTTHEGRFGRMFPNLPPCYTHPSTLQALGKKGGPMDGGLGRNPTTTIPMGMVFFGQFIDHDITLDTTSSLDRVNDADATQNFRTPSLDLDCIYGAGPEASNYLYRNGMHLYTAKEGTALSTQSNQHRNHDLTRTADGTAVIGDPRNDENRIVSQIQLAMINFHNHVVDHVISEHGYNANDLKKSSVRKEVYEEARQLVTWHYHWIVINEFLPVMVGQPLVNKTLGQGRKFYTRNRGYIPIEFSAAAYRFGHSLAPQKLKVQKAQTHDFELFGATLGFGFSPITDNKQVVEWEVMFDIDPANPAQRTDKLDTKLPSDLLALPFIQEGENSLATRNLLRGQSFLLPAGENMAAQMGVDQVTIDKVLNHIDTSAPGLDFSNGVPLWYYILAEAECVGKNVGNANQPGEGLGPVGGTIICETLLGLIELDSTSFMSQNRNWQPTLPSTGGPGTFTMADLLTF